MCECNELISIDMKTPRKAYLSAFYKRSLAFESVKNRIPAIMSQVIENLARRREEIAKKFGLEAREELTLVIGELANLNYEIITNHSLSPLSGDAPDLEIYNEYIKKQTSEEGTVTFFNSIWLLADCYMFRKIRNIFENTNNLKEYDVFRSQKKESFRKSLPLIETLAEYFLNVIEQKPPSLKEEFLSLTDQELPSLKEEFLLLTDQEPSSLKEEFTSLTDQEPPSFKEDVISFTDQVPLSLKEEFISFIKLNLWADKCDLFLQTLDQVEENATLFDTTPFDPNILIDHSEQIFDAVSNPETTSGIIDIILANSGFELITDFCLADYLITKIEAITKIRFYVKTIPWFISDVMAFDFNWILNRMRKSHDPSTNKLGEKWLNYMDTNQWSIEESDFWTLPYEYTYMASTNPELYKKLSEARVVIFKGDLNYRKLFGERNWDPMTSVEEGLQGFHPSKLVILRTVKADIICGIEREGLIEEIDAKSPNWMMTGDYGLIQFCGKVVEIDLEPEPQSQDSSGKIVEVDLESESKSQDSCCRYF